MGLKRRITEAGGALSDVSRSAEWRRWGEPQCAEEWWGLLTFSATSQCSLQRVEAGCQLFVSAKDEVIGQKPGKVLDQTVRLRRQMQS